MLSAEEILVEYKKQLRKRKTEAEQASHVARKRARTEDGGVVAGAGAVDDEMLVDAILDDDAQAVVKGFEDFLAGLDGQRAMAWAGLSNDQGTGASTHEAIELAQDDDEAAAPAARAATAATAAAEPPHATCGAAAAACG